MADDEPMMEKSSALGPGEYPDFTVRARRARARVRARAPTRGAGVPLTPAHCMRAARGARRPLSLTPPPLLRPPQKEQDKVRNFIRSFRVPSLDGGPKGPLRYAQQVIEVKRRQRTEIAVELDDVALVSDDAFVRAIEGNTKRYLELFSKVVDEELVAGAGGAAPITADDEAEEIRKHHRIKQLQEIARSVGGEPETLEQLMAKFPSELYRKYELRIVPRTTAKPLSIREVAGSSLGRLVQVKAIVLRTTDVKPLMRVAAYSCDACGCELFKPVTDKTFMPLSECTSQQCMTNQTRGKVHMRVKCGKFVKYQTLRIQELPDTVPVGNIPRTLTVILKGELTRRAKAGDTVVVGGIFMPTPYTGFQAVRAGLTTDTYLDAQSVTCLKNEEIERLDAAAEELIFNVSINNPYGTLAKSIAPEIFGLEDVKKVLLLQLVGGETREQGDGMKTRGDINVCLMGDPGVAKSQLLKHIERIAPRCVYTTGKGSSGVGLTAAVVRDPLTNELMLEGGALVLADKSICCIDEFDKMEETDRTAIHEVMEQQQVSIAKAGITTTLNARTAILAAANPRYGRYNRLADRDAHTALMKNINLPAALLSRFDVLFLLLDKSDRDDDTSLAEHVTYLHKNEVHPPLDFTPFEPIFIRQYVKLAREVRPFVTPELRDYIVEAYVDIRAKDKAQSLANNSRATTTARQLLSILRLAEAHAKLNFRTRVDQADVDEAIRLIQMSKASVMEADADMRGSRADPISRMWELVKDKLQHKPHFGARGARAGARGREGARLTPTSPRPPAARPPPPPPQSRSRTRCTSRSAPALAARTLTSSSPSTRASTSSRSTRRARASTSRRQCRGVLLNVL